MPGRVEHFPSRWRGVAVLGCVAVMLAAPEVGQAQARSTDSAGVRIVQVGKRLKAPVTFALSDAPTLIVGSGNTNASLDFDAGNGQFAAIRLGNGTLVVGDRTRVQLFDRLGKRLAVVGGSSWSRAEFAAVAGICRTRGDTIVVADEQLRRITILDRDGKFVRAFSSKDYYAEGQFCFGDGSILGVGRPVAGADGHFIAPLQRVALDGARVADLGGLDFGPHDYGVRRQPSLVAAGRSFYFGNTLAHEIRAFDNSGRLRSVVRTADSLHVITEAELGRGGPNPKGRHLRASRGVDQLKVKTWPAYSMLRSDPDGLIWIQEWQSPGAGPRQETWTALDPAGGVVGRLIVPMPAFGDSSRAVLSFGSDEVLLRETDANGAARLVVRRLDRRAAPR